ncbi:MAG: sulfatase modifying factor 1 [Verrucomicrobiales bacterium]|jgi:sulfatase modifying factor 1
MTFQSLSKRVQVLLCASLCIFALVGSVDAVTFTWAEIGNLGGGANPTDPGNLNDPNVYGSVGYDYRIATHEVTNGQYTEFLNNVAASDPGGLYNVSMASNLTYGGIVKSGPSGSFSYSAKAGFENKPVTYVSWLDGARFSNWMHNGQPTGAQGLATTESGAYDMTISTPVRLTAATVFLPSEDEWYKAAYYAPGSGGDNYWQYPTQSNAAPTAESPPGGFNSANYSGAGSVLTDVGAYTNTTSFYGAFDMGGNVWEWNEAVNGASRGLRGGSWNSSSNNLQSSFRIDVDPSNVYGDGGFRVASIPEPATCSLVLIALVTLGCRRRRR